MKNGMSVIEKEKWTDFAQALTIPQREIILGNMRTTELQHDIERRTMVASTTINKICSLMDNAQIDENDLLGMQAFLKNLRSLIR